MGLKDIKQLKQFITPFELNQLYTLHINSEYTEMSASAIEKVIKTIIAFVAVQPTKGIIPLKIASLLTETDWQWMTNRGSLNKRIGKWLKDTHDINSTEVLSTAIGNVVREFIVKDQIYYFDFVKEFNWKKGEFADDDSCFFMNGRKSVLPAMESDKRFFAIRFFKKEKQRAVSLKEEETRSYYISEEASYRGIGRAWMAVDQLKTIAGKPDPFYLIFNGYGLTTAQCSSIFASFTGLSTNRVGILNNNEVDGDLWTNEGGVAVGDPTCVNRIKNYEMGLDTANPYRKTHATSIDQDGKLDQIQKRSHKNFWGGISSDVLFDYAEKVPQYYKSFAQHKGEGKKVTKIKTNADSFTTFATTVLDDIDHPLVVEEYREIRNRFASIRGVNA